MKTDRSSLKFLQGIILALTLAFPLAVPVSAANLTWDADATFDSNFGGSGTWDTSLLNWSGAGPADEAWATNTTAGDTAIFSGTAGTVTLGTGINALGLTFTTPGYTIELDGNTLGLGTGGINATALASGTTTINGPGSIGLAGNQAWDVGSGSTLELFAGVSSSSAGTKILTVQGAGNTTLNSAITAGSGAMNLAKLGAGTLTLSGGGVLGAGSITTYGGNNSAVLLGGTTNITGGAYTSAGEFVVGGVLTAGGAGVDTNLTMDGGSLTVSAFLSLGRGNGVGGVTSSIVLNESSSLTSNAFSAGFNNGSGLNLPKGTFTLNDSSTFTVNNGNFFLGESAGSNMTMTLNDTSTVNGGTGTIAIGVQNGNGTLNINTGAIFNSGGEIRVAFSSSNGIFNGTGTINVDGGTLNTRALTIARNNNDVASTLNATVNLTAGTINVTNQNTLVGWRGTSSTGTLNISGGSFNQGTTGAANLVIGSFGGVTGTVNISSTGSLTLQNTSSLAFSNAAGQSPNGTLNINGGSVTFYSDAGATIGGTGVVDLMSTNATGNNTVNLNGGTLTTNQIKSSFATATRVFNFNGGTLKASNSTLAATFFTSTAASRANVRDGGAVIDTNGLNVTIGQALLHTNIGGDNAIDGGLTKQGAGALILSSGNTYNGDTFIDDGSFTLANSGSMVLKVLDASNTQIYGDASDALAIFDGQFRLDLSTVTVTSGSWSLVNVSNLTETFGATFSLVDDASLITFAQSNDVWTAADGAKTWTFTEATGLLQVVPEPDAFALLFGGIGMLVMFRRRR